VAVAVVVITGVDDEADAVGDVGGVPEWVLVLVPEESIGLGEPPKPALLLPPVVPLLPCFPAEFTAATALEALAADDGPSLVPVLATVPAGRVGLGLLPADGAGEALLPGVLPLLVVIP
jgi:hypothetical protein